MLKAVTHARRPQTACRPRRQRPPQSRPPRPECGSRGKGGRGEPQPPSWRSGGWGRVGRCGGEAQGGVEAGRGVRKAVRGIGAVICRHVTCVRRPSCRGRLRQSYKPFLATAPAHPGGSRTRAVCSGRPTTAACACAEGVRPGPARRRSHQIVYPGMQAGRPPSSHERPRCFRLSA